jgi:hypothetical protein
MLLVALYIWWYREFRYHHEICWCPTIFFWVPKTGKFGTIRQKHPQNKVCRAHRDRRITRQTRVEHNKHTSKVQNFNGSHIWYHSLQNCQLVSTKFHWSASLLYLIVLRRSHKPRAIRVPHHFGMLLRSGSRGARWKTTKSTHKTKIPGACQLVAERSVQKNFQS